VVNELERTEKELDVSLLRELAGFIRRNELN